MQTSPKQLAQWLAEPEGLRLEFKEANHRFDFEKLVLYCVALANEGGGEIILGVTDQRPRRIVGTAAFEEPGRTEAGLYSRLSHRIPIEELRIPEGRVLIVHVPSRLAGTAWQYQGRYLKRAGDEFLEQQNPRNRRLAEALEKCGLIERSGQGMNLMVESAIRHGKPQPSFHGTDAHQVRLTLEGGIRNRAHSAGGATAMGALEAFLRQPGLVLF